MDDQGGEAEVKSAQGQRTPVWSAVAAAFLVIALIATFVVGIALTATGGQTPNESYTLTVLLALFSIAASWIIAVIFRQHQEFDQKRQEEQARERTEQIARSAVVRVFRSLTGLGRIQELAAERHGSSADLKKSLGLVEELAKFVFQSTGDSIADWRRFAPEAVDNELERARVPHKTEATLTPVPKPGDKQEDTNAK